MPHERWRRKGGAKAGAREGSDGGKAAATEREARDGKGRSGGEGGATAKDEAGARAGRNEARARQARRAGGNGLRCT